MTTAEGIELAEIKKRLRKNHATREEIARGRELLSCHPGLLERFEALVSQKFEVKKIGDRTSADRKRRQRERERSFEIPDNPLDADRRESCRSNLVKFGVTYCPHMLKHPPSDLMVRSLVTPLQNVILYGGQQVIEYPRGTGKTTWLKIALIWAVVYGYKRMVIVLSATNTLAGKIVTQIKNAFEKSQTLAEDFPALAVPVIDIKGNWRRASTQKFEGEPTGLSFSQSEFVLPKIMNADGSGPREVAAGARFMAFGLEGAFKGVGDDADRPDLILIDDPQKRKNSSSQKEMDRIESTIVDDALPSFGQTGIVAAVMTVTPICVNDIAWRFASRSRHPEWGLSKQRYLITKSEKFDDLFPAFKAAFNEDVAIADAAAAHGETVDAKTKWALSDRFYRDHIEDFKGTTVVDPLNFADGETDAIHHLLKLMAKFHDLASFDAEYQMDVTVEAEASPVEPEEVERKVNGYAYGQLPEGTWDCVGFCDVNTSSGAGLRWGILAVGPGRVTAVVAYGRFPRDGSALVPKGASPDEKSRLIRTAMREVVYDVLKVPLRLQDGTRVVPKAMCFDAGYATEDVYAVVGAFANERLYGMEVLCSHGQGWKQYKSSRRRGEDEKVMVEKNKVYSAVTFKKINGRVIARKYLAMHVDYWREIAQCAFRAQPLTSGSCSLWGRRASDHHEFALEVTYERLVRTYRDEKTLCQAWDYHNENKGHNHWGDVLVGCFALAAWKDLYRAPARPSLTAPRVKSITGSDAMLGNETRAELENASKVKTVRPAATRRTGPFGKSPWAKH